MSVCAWMHCSFDVTLKPKSAYAVHWHPIYTVAFISQGFATVSNLHLRFWTHFFTILECLSQHLSLQEFHFTCLKMCDDRGEARWIAPFCRCLICPTFAGSSWQADEAKSLYKLNLNIYDIIILIFKYMCIYIYILGTDELGLVASDELRLAGSTPISCVHGLKSLWGIG